MKDFSIRVLALVCSVVFLTSSSTMASNVSPYSSEIGRTSSVEYAASKGKARGRGVRRRSWPSPKRSDNGPCSVF